MIWFIASVWIDVHDPVTGHLRANRPIVLRLQAMDEEDFRRAVRTYADHAFGAIPHEVVTIGPISESKVQA